MCEFLSWIEKGNKVLFLTHDLVFETEKGKVLQEWCQNGEDYTGHGAIRYYFGLERDEGVNKECTNFTTPANFPKPIVKAIQSCKMRGIGIDCQLLAQPAWMEYSKVEQAARAEYEKVEQPAWTEYQKVEQPAWTEYEKAEQPAWTEYQKVNRAARAEYDKIEQPARAEYLKIKQPARAEYEKIKRAARAEYDEATDTAFWDLFMISENRNPNWR